MPDVNFGHCTPTLRVADRETSIAYYIEVLGFGIDWRDRFFAQVTRGHSALMLSQRDRGRRADRRLARRQRRAVGAPA